MVAKWKKKRKRKKKISEQSIKITNKLMNSGAET